MRGPGSRWSDPSWRRSSVAAAYALLRGSPCGERAVREGWICQLFDFCRLHQRWPSGPECEQLRAKHEAIRWELLPKAAAEAARGRAERLSKEVARV